MKNKYTVIGSGFSALSAAAFLAKSGKDVSVIEKNTDFGGRARQFSHNGFVFDMGPSWYWMPDVFDNFFKQFGRSTEDYYKLEKLDPGFQIIFNNEHSMKIPKEWPNVIDLFEKYEKGSTAKLLKFISDAEIKYNIGMNSLVYQPGLSFLELLKKDVILNIGRMSLFTSYQKHIYKNFKNPFLRKLLEFPVLFLGASAKDIPALYSLMGYSALKQGTFYPIGGFGMVIQGMISLCKELGVKFYNNQEVKSFSFTNNMISEIVTDNKRYQSDYTICAADYEHFDQKILPKKYRNYSSKYWENRVMSPSSLLFFLGVEKKIDKLEHHNLFFDNDLDKHSDEIYKNPKWPTEPLFYACCPSKTDKLVAPSKMENLFLLMPLASGLKDNEELRNKYFDNIMARLEKYCGHEIRSKIVYKKSYCISDFKNDYNAFKGNAYGLANTLLQTANLKPRIRNKYISNLFFTGQLTVPGPGVPPSLISGEVVAKYLLRF